MIVGDSYARSIGLLGLDRFLAAHGADLPALLTEVGLPPDCHLKSDFYFPFRRYVALLDLAATRTGLGNFGVAWALQAAPDFQYLGPVILMSRFVSTMGEWADTALRYWHYHTNGFTFRIIRHDNGTTGVLRFSSDAFTYPSRHVYEHAVASVVGATRTVCNRQDESPLCVRFQHGRPDDLTEHQQMFRCPVEFGALHTEVEFDLGNLAYKTSGGLKLFKPLMAFFVQERIRRMPFNDQTTTTAVAMAIPSIIGSGHCNIEAVAEALGQNVKQLQRLLAKEDTSFSEILDKVRQNMARNLLSQTSIPVASVAGLLDYAAPAPFTAAFHRWEGLSPIQYRRRQRQPAKEDSAAAPIQD